MRHLQTYEKLQKEWERSHFYFENNDGSIRISTSGTPKEDDIYTNRNKFKIIYAKSDESKVYYIIEYYMKSLSSDPNHYNIEYIIIYDVKFDDNKVYYKEIIDGIRRIEKFDRIPELHGYDEGQKDVYEWLDENNFYKIDGKFKEIVETLNDSKELGLI